ncbi:MAG: PEP-CTERM sorting domain-containing protein [Phycisphaerae bacterium]|nr:PEP-CTERM sorting domain-containing protein [Phycisphaerae bacterium]
MGPRTLMVAACTLLSTSIVHASLIIDDFDSGANFAIKTRQAGPTSATSVLPAPGVLGGTRDALLEYVAGAGSFKYNRATFSPADSRLNFSNDSGMKGRLTLTYNFAATDFTTDGADSVWVQFTAADLTYDATVTLKDSAGRVSTSTLHESAGPDFAKFWYVDFTGSANLNAVTSLTLAIEGVSSGDYALDLIDTRAPEPATLALLAVGGLGMIGRALRARRSRRR